MNILICDDIREEALRLEDIVKTSGFEAECRLFSSGEDALAHMRSGAKIDVCFLDILMPGMSGIELAQKMREEKFSGEIVFLTTTNEYASESYAVQAFSYVIKPPDARRVSEIVRKIMDAHKKPDAVGIHVLTRNLTRLLLFHEISHVEVIDKKVYFRLLDGSEVVLTAAFNELLPKLLMDKRFAQCHRSYVVNLDAVSYIEDRVVFLRCGRKVIIAKSFTGFCKKYCEWIFKDTLQ